MPRSALRSARTRAPSTCKRLPGMNRNQHREQRWQQSARSPDIKPRQGERAVLYAILDQFGDEVARYHEKDVDADESTAKAKCAQGEKKYREHRNCTQSVDIGSVFCANCRGNLRGVHSARIAHSDFYSQGFGRYPARESRPEGLGISANHVPAAGSRLTGRGRTGRGEGGGNNRSIG